MRGEFALPVSLTTTCYQECDSFFLFAQSYVSSQKSQSYNFNSVWPKHELMVMLCTCTHYGNEKVAGN